jgi:hypothetical protein
MRTQLQLTCIVRVELGTREDPAGGRKVIENNGDSEWVVSENKKVLNITQHCHWRIIHTVKWDSSVDIDLTRGMSEKGGSCISGWDVAKKFSVT